MEAEAHREVEEATQAALPRLFSPAAMLRVEGAALLALSVLLYRANGEGWVLFGLLLLVPDLSMLGYAAGPKVGSAVYNVVHSYPLPGILAAFGLVGESTLLVAVALVWFAHIGMDRLLGYGLKYPGAFVDTHLGRV